MALANVSIMGPMKTYKTEYINWVYSQQRPTMNPAKVESMDSLYASAMCELDFQCSTNNIYPSGLFSKVGFFATLLHTLIHTLTAWYV